MSIAFTPMAGSLVLLAALSLVDLQRLDQYDAAWADPDAGPAAAERARADFAGRGVEIATQFLLHTDPRPRNGAYYFVLGAVGDADTALTLIRALVNPPARESGILDRHFAEIAGAIEAVLSGEETRRDTRIVAALERAVATARGRPYGSGAPEALEAVRLIGHSRSVEAASALSRLANDPDAAIRAAAAAALGQHGPLADAPPADRPAPVQELLRLLASDSSPAARRQSAEALGAVKDPATEAGLRTALDSERDPRVVDAIIGSLRRHGAPIDDPSACRGLIGRAWEAVVAREMLNCWLRGGAAREDLVQAALEGPATQRAAALSALTESDPASRARTLIVDGMSEPVRVDPPLGDRLMEAVVSVLSHGDAISASTRDASEQALWQLSGRRMVRAIAYADRVTPRIARFRASAALARADTAAYDAARRWRQIALALGIAAALGLLAAWRSSVRRPALLLGVSAVAWVMWTVRASGVRDLPPPPLQILSVAALAFACAGLVAGAAALVPRRARGFSATAFRFALTLIATAVVAGGVCAVTRSAGLFPSDLEGWELIFDPLGAAILGVALSVVLMAMDGALSRTRPELTNGRDVP